MSSPLRALLQAVEVELVDRHLVDLDRGVLAAGRAAARHDRHDVVQHEARRALRRGAAVGEALELDLRLDVGFEALQAILRRRLRREFQRQQRDSAAAQ